ncbi:MAG: hypothetical protein ORN49_12320 [Rhodobacteraceae bacterium]|nr:hypothetical protein [Paracoccaceae bacterium]
MGSDMSLVFGLLLILLAVPSAVSAFSASRSLRGTVTLLALGGLLVAWASYSAPRGYRAEDIPDTVLRVIAHFIR